MEGLGIRRMVLVLAIIDGQSRKDPKAGVFRGPARVLMQERDITAEGSTLRGATAHQWRA